MQFGRAPATQRMGKVPGVVTRSNLVEYLHVRILMDSAAEQRVRVGEVQHLRPEV
jgi:hypothetical protein